MRWSEIPPAARKYIIYHTIISPFLITWYMLPLYLFMTGYGVLDVGIIFTAVNIAAIPAAYAVGKVFESVPIRHGLVIIDALEGVSNIVYGLAKGAIAPFVLFIGMLIDKIAGVLYPLYQAAERILYPRDRLKEVLAWHMRLPEASQLIGFLVLGYVFGYIFTTPEEYRLGFLAIGTVSFGTIIYLLKALPKMDKRERIESEAPVFRVDKEFRLILLVEALVTAAWFMAPEFVMLNYVVNTLGLTLFEAMIVEAAISLGAIAATYVTDAISDEHMFRAMAVGYALITAWAAIMLASPPFPVVVAAYFISKFGDTLVFPFYGKWLFSKIPKEKATTVFGALSSYRRLIRLFTPALAGLLASMHPTLPYLASLALFAATAALMEYLFRTYS